MHWHDGNSRDDLVVWDPVLCARNSAGAGEAGPVRAPEPQRQKADGGAARLPIEAYAVTPGTKFLVKLEDELSTKDTRENTKFKVKTLEPLEAGSGIYLPSGAEIRGHISHVEPAEWRAGRNYGLRSMSSHEIWQSCPSRCGRSFDRPTHQLSAHDGQLANSCESHRT